ncbi:CRE-SRX-44 protein [Caenorhabditis remanei]|uniref:CRE-SRX-44 protein n=1 Tax=Caenorhabditis remanei TaxID=31234 RepID=E3MZ10_CAERE|nr:CRE-SRX-44 protein [Caenorhabditis remanei]
MHFRADVEKKKSTFRNDSYFKEADENYKFGPEDTLIGIIISSVCILGVTIQSAVVTGAYNIKNIKGSVFGALILNETFGQFAATVFSFSFFFFGLALNWLAIVSHSEIFGNISLIIFPIILGSHTLMAFNRFCASSMPFSYRKVFSPKTVIIYIIINWTVPPVVYSYFYIFHGCYFPFFQFGWVFMEALRNEKCGSKLLLLSLTFQFLLVFAISVFDIVTFIILVTCRRKVFKSQSKDIRKREINFAMQVLVQGSVMMFVGMWYVSGYTFLPGKRLDWKIFTTTTLSSTGVNCIAPIVICFFNAEYRRWIISLIRKRRSGHSLSVVTSRVSDKF